MDITSGAWLSEMEMEEPCDFVNQQQQTCRYYSDSVDSFLLPSPPSPSLPSLPLTAVGLRPNKLHLGFCIFAAIAPPIVFHGKSLTGILAAVDVFSDHILVGVGVKFHFLRFLYYYPYKVSWLIYEKSLKRSMKEKRLS